uniref:Uncharacterized protein n=1 Tax=viral metagenome TaxID=1070528 RepID=A0A6C0AQ96_9ZZZZ
MSATFYLPIDRLRAEVLLQKFPQSPILRPCLYTKTNPEIFAVSYSKGGKISHSLVERSQEGTFYEISMRLSPDGNKVFLRSVHSFKDMAELETVIKNLCSGEFDEDPRD